MSPLRTVVKDFSPIIKVGDNTLYIGPRPTKEFIYDCKCYIVFNCANSANSNDIANIPSGMSLYVDHILCI